MTARANSIKKKIQSIDFAISLLEKERRLLRKDLYVEKWENNPFAHDKQMRKTAEFFYDLNYFSKSISLALDMIHSVKFCYQLLISFKVLAKRRTPYL